MTKLFEEYAIGEMLCIDPGTDIELKGLKKSSQRQFLKMKISKCVNAGTEDDECNSENEVNNFMSEFLEENRYFIADFYYLNTAFNVNDGEPEVKYIEDKIWLTFSEGHSSEAFVELGNY